MSAPKPDNSKILARRLGGTTLAAVLMSAGLLTGCGDDSEPAQQAQACDPAADERGRPYACIAGAVTGEDGEPVVAVNIAACTSETCIIGKTSDSGEYNIQRLPVEPHKVEIFGAMKGYMTLAFFQDVLPGELALAGRTLVLPRRTNEAVPWLPATGGSVALAKGKLLFSAEAGTLRYLVGTPEEEMVVEAVEVPVGKLVPYDSEPWKGKESKSLAFVVNPFPLTSSKSVDLTIKGVGAAANALYTLYAAHSKTGELEQVGILVGGAGGDLVLQPGATLIHLTTLVVVPN